MTGLWLISYIALCILVIVLVIVVLGLVRQLVFCAEGTILPMSPATAVISMQVHVVGGYVDLVQNHSRWSLHLLTLP